MTSEIEHRPIVRFRARMAEERCLADGEFWPCRAISASDQRRVPLTETPAAPNTWSKPAPGCEHRRVDALTQWTDDGEDGTKPDGVFWYCRDCGVPFAPTEAAVHPQEAGIDVGLLAAVGYEEYYRDNEGLRRTWPDAPEYSHNVWRRWAKAVSARLTAASEPGASDG